MDKHIKEKLQRFRKATKIRKQAIFQSSKINEQTKELKLIDGDFDEQNVFIVENGELFFSIKSDDFVSLVNNYKILQEKIFNLRLERAVLNYLPIDYNDVYSVAKLAIEDKIQSGSDIEEIDFSKIVKDIKKEHPNLFLDLPMFKN